MPMWRLAALRAVIGPLIVLSGITAATHGRACSTASQRPLPKCASWNRGDTFGAVIRNGCDFSFNYFVQFSRSNALEGRVAAGETVLVGPLQAPSSVRRVRCCSTDARC